MLELVSDFGKPSAPVPTIIMACAPTTHEVKGELVGFTVNPSEIEFAMKQGLDEIIYVEPQVVVLSFLKILSRNISRIFSFPIKYYIYLLPHYIYRYNYW